MMDSLDVDDNLELNADKKESTEMAPQVSEDVATPRHSVDEIEIKKEEVEANAPRLHGSWFYFSKGGMSPLYSTVQTFHGVKSRYNPWFLNRRWGVQSNEISQEKGHHLPLYPFYGFRKISH